jgi:mRNA-degrading endonuclease toxin of MazEF toxin-antitoxin module
VTAQIRRGEIWLRRASPERGDRKIRPVLVISPDWRHQCRTTVVVLPISTRLDLLTPLRFILPAEPANGLRQDSLLYCDDPTTLLISRLIERVGGVASHQVDLACARLLESLQG